MKKLILAALLMVVTSGCGASMVRNVDPLKGTDTVGIMVPRFQVNMATGYSAIPMSDEVHDQARTIIIRDILAQFKEKGITAKVVEPSDKVAMASQKYLELPRWGYHLSKPEEINLGDLSSIFKDNNIDRLLILGGLTEIVGVSAASQLAATAGTVVVGMALNSVVPMSSAKTATFTLFSEVSKNGTLSFYNFEQFTRKGNFLDKQERADMARAAVEGWLKEVPKGM